MEAGKYDGSICSLAQNRKRSEKLYIYLVLRVKSRLPTFKLFSGYRQIDVCLRRLEEPRKKENLTYTHLSLRFHGVDQKGRAWCVMLLEVQIFPLPFNGPTVVEVKETETHHHVSLTPWQILYASLLPQKPKTVSTPLNGLDSSLSKHVRQEADEPLVLEAKGYLAISNKPVQALTVTIYFHRRGSQKHAGVPLMILWDRIQTKTTESMKCPSS